MTAEVKLGKKRSRKGLVAGLLVGGILGATAIIIFAPRSGVNGRLASGTALNPKDLLAQAQALLGVARDQVREAVAEGKATSQATRANLTARYEAIRANPDLPALPPAP
jgi:gas vesicle protein